MDSEPDLEIFVSHAHEDATVARALVKLLRAAFHLEDGAILCTSVDGYGLTPGADTDEELREKIRTATTFVGVLSPHSFASTYVLTEIGARWGAKLDVTPLLAPGADASIIKGPIAGKNALRADNRAHLHQLLEHLSNTLNRRLSSASVYEDELTAVAAMPPPKDTTRARVSSSTDPQRRPGSEGEPAARATPHNKATLSAGQIQQEPLGPEPAFAARQNGPVNQSQSPGYRPEPLQVSLVSTDMGIGVQVVSRLPEPLLGARVAVTDMLMLSSVESRYVKTQHFYPDGKTFHPFSLDRKVTLFYDEPMVRPFGTTATSSKDALRIEGTTIPWPGNQAQPFSKRLTRPATWRVSVQITADDFEQTTHVYFSWKPGDSPRPSEDV